TMSRRWDRDRKKYNQDDPGYQNGWTMDCDRCIRGSSDTADRQDRPPESKAFSRRAPWNRSGPCESNPVPKSPLSERKTARQSRSDISSAPADDPLEMAK